MPAHFDAIGFQPEPRPDGVKNLVLQAANLGRRFQSPRGWYSAWAPGNGVELWVAMENSGHVLGCSPFFLGISEVSFRLEHFETRPPVYAPPLEGGLAGWVAASPTDPRSGLCPLLVDLPDFDLRRDALVIPSHLTLRVAAFSHWLDCFPNDADYLASQAQTEGTARYSSDYFSPSGLFAPKDEPDWQPKAYANFAGHVEGAEVVTNPISNRPFHHLVVRTGAGVFDVVADPAIPSGTPKVGGVVHGEFWLSGRILTKDSK